jgi:hypothetical protein
MGMAYVYDPIVKEPCPFCVSESIDEEGSKDLGYADLINGARRLYIAGIAERAAHKKTR